MNDIKEFEASSLKRAHEYGCSGKVLLGVYFALESFVILFHLFAFVVESILISSVGKQLFGDLAVNCAVLALNQGFYNLVLVFGNVWAMVLVILTMKADSQFSVGEAFRLRLFFLGAVVFVGIVGGVSVSATIAIGQALPAGLALIVTAIEFFGFARR